MDVTARHLDLIKKAKKKHPGEEIIPVKGMFTGSFNMRNGRLCWWYDRLTPAGPSTCVVREDKKS